MSDNKQLQDPHQDPELPVNQSPTPVNSNPPENDSPSQDNAEAAAAASIAIEIPPSIRFFRKGPDNRLLVATVAPSDDFADGFSSDTMVEWIRSQGCAEWFLHEETIELFTKEVRRLKQSKEYIIAERKACQVEIKVSSDRLSAWIRVSPAYGEPPPTEDLLRQALESQNVRFGVNEGLIQRIVKDGQCERELIAEGTPPKQGNPVKFEQLVKESSHKGVPQERKDGTVDYRDLGLFLSVTPETPLLKRIPPTSGTTGIGVDGTVLDPPPPIDRILHPGIGTAFSHDDPDIIISTRAGKPDFIDNTVRVDATLEIDAVDLSTGNVTFDGDILVRGSVESGFEVKAGHDLKILDTVEGANLTAGRNLSLLTGIYGKNKSKLAVKGNIEAKFLSDCTIQCSGNIDVTDLIAHCIVECEGTINLGKQGGKGQALGGKLTAMKGVNAHILGSMSEAATVVELAPPRALLIRASEIEKQIDATRQSHTIADKNYQSALKAAPDENNPAIKKLSEKVLSFSEKLKDLNEEYDAIQLKMEITKMGKIRASEVHRGVILRIGTTKQIVSDLMTDVIFQQPAEKKSINQDRD